MQRRSVLLGSVVLALREIWPVRAIPDSPGTCEYAKCQPGREKDLRWCDFSGQDLRGADFQHSVLRFANFAGAHLREANPLYADLSGACLVRTDLRGASLEFGVNRNGVLCGTRLANYLTLDTGQRYPKRGSGDHPHSPLFFWLTPPQAVSRSSGSVFPEKRIAFCWGSHWVKKRTVWPVSGSPRMRASSWLEKLLPQDVWPALVSL